MRFLTLHGPSVLLLCATVCFVTGDFESEHHGAHHPIDEEHYGTDGEHNPDFDHEAVLGSREADEEFEHLDPEEAKYRLGALVDKMDTDGDGFVSKEELKNWVIHSFKTLNEEEAERRLEEQDGDDDGMITWEEYVKAVYDHDLKELEKLEKEENEDTKYIQESLKLDMLKFAAADLNKDNKLDHSEYAAFLHPYDYKHMTDVEVQTRLADLDKDKDGVLSFDEYVGDEELSEENRIVEQETFGELDKNKDGHLDKSEIRDWVAPDNEEAAQKEAEHLFSETDGDKDGKLSKEEIVDQHELWVGHQATDYGDHLMRDEL